MNQIPLEDSPQVLAAKAREIAKSLGYAKRPFDTAFGWEYDVDCLRYLEAQNDSAGQARIKANWPPALYFWYRESPSYLYHPWGYFTNRTQPHRFDPGMLEAVLDSEGRLIEFHARPPAERNNTDAIRAPDWGRLFAAAGLDAGRFTPAEPALIPQSFSDARAAWLGSSDQAPHDWVKVEAAAYQGRPFFFRSIGPWSRPKPTEPFLLADFTFPSFVVFAVVLPIGAALLAWRNARLGRGDRRGAFRLATFAFVCTLVRSLAWQHHVPALVLEVGSIFFALRDALTFGTIFWVLCMAFEPYVRKRSPGSLISWSLLLSGRLRDPLVGADLLVGCLLGVVALLVVRPLVSPFVVSLAPRLMPTMAAWLSLWSWLSVYAVGGALSCVFILTAMLLFVRLQWIAVLLFIGVMSVAIALPGATLSAVVLVCITWYALTKLAFFVLRHCSMYITLRDIFRPRIHRHGTRRALCSPFSVSCYSQVTHSTPRWPGGHSGETTFKRCDRPVLSTPIRIITR